MHAIRSIIAFLVGAGLFSFMVGLLNHYLAQIPSFYLYIVCSGLFICYAAIHLGHRTGLSAVFLLGLFGDAATPLPFGSEAILFASLQTVLFRFRGRIVSQNTNTRRALIFTVNLLVFLVIVIMRIFSGGSPISITDFFSLIASQLFLLLSGNWYFDFQNLLCSLIAPSGKTGPHVQEAK